MFGGNGVQTVAFSSANDLVTFSGSSLGFYQLRGSGNDLYWSSQRRRCNGTSSLVVLTEMTQSGGAISGNMVGRDISFWGGAQQRHLRIWFRRSITGGAGGTAYFWNESGADSIVLQNGVTSTADTGVFFGVHQRCIDGHQLRYCCSQGNHQLRCWNNVQHLDLRSPPMSGLLTATRSPTATMVTIAFSGSGGASIQGGVF